MGSTGMIYSLNQTAVLPVLGTIFPGSRNFHACLLYLLIPDALFIDMTFQKRKLLLESALNCMHVPDESVPHVDLDWLASTDDSSDSSDEEVTKHNNSLQD